MNNLEWLFTHDRERILRNLTMEDNPCRICPKHDAANPDVCDSGRCTEVMREWLLAKHVDDESCRQDAEQGERQESPDCESDSHEKLEADVLVNFGDGLVRSIIMRLLERQAEITERETEKKWSCFSDSVDGHIAELSREIGTLRAERDRYRELCGKLLDAADDMRRVRDAFDQFDRGEA